ncbi:MAG TPA: glycerol-3-phosphate 1-O-acyltransferase PlsB [Steroidobacteraceae bacterium]|jgi:glycerol-3-phosphate O-acyltransferase|nr:glycerol-3-phosphate 1-O-acyltransferase PlsB [Steroidobacteraceae bacterium]
MNPIRGLVRAWRWLVRTMLGRWVKVTIKPGDIAETLAARPRPVCYVLENESQVDLAVLQNACAGLHMPRPDRCFALQRLTPFRGLRARSRAPRYLVQLVESTSADPDFDVDLVPVAIYWGRAPQKEQSLWRLLFTEDWVLVGRFRKILNVLINGRNTVVYFGEPVGLREALAGLPSSRAVRRLLRALRAVFRAQRASTIGPDLSHRRTMVAHILRTQMVRHAVRREMQARRELAAAARGRGRRGLKRRASRRAVLMTARSHALEIAANYSQPFVTFMSSALSWVWTRLYDGVEFVHVEKLEEIGDGAEIIYVPCHRSHMDYLLLSYVIYRKGFAVPHVAAGVNLNMPVIGRFLRKGGAFFLRRSFKGQALYAAVFTKYLGFMMARGHPLEYFIEGGRSRTGRLQPPRTGMLSMTVRSYMREPNRPVVFMPVYFGYERIVEGRTYIGELSGRPKEKESVLGVIKALSVLRSRFGKVHVNLGEPIKLDELLDSYHPTWRGAPAAGAEESPPGWVAEATSALASQIAIGINAAAAVTPINLVSMAVLATPRQALLEADLKRQLELYQRLLRDAPYAPLVTVTADSAEQMTRYAESMGMLERQAHPLGDIMRMTAERAVLATYYRNNILHLFAMPSLIACCFVSNARMRTVDIQRLAWRVYPYIRSELALRWPEEAIGTVTLSLLDAMARSDLLQPNEDRSEWYRPSPTSLEAIQLALLAEATIQTLERYYLVIALLLQAGSGSITQEALEERCHLMAQRMSILYGLDSPEFFDKNLFRSFIELLGRRGVIATAENHTLSFGEPLLGVAADAQMVLSEQLRHDILQVTLGQ